VDTTRPLGALFLVVCAGFLAWSLGARRPLAWRSWSFSPPSGRMLLLQLPLTALDWVLAAGVLFALLQEGHGISFWAAFGVFMASEALGMISHVPGGLVVFESVVLHLCPRTSRRRSSSARCSSAAPSTTSSLVSARSCSWRSGGLQRHRLAVLERWFAPLGEALVPRVLPDVPRRKRAALTGSLPAGGAAWPGCATSCRCRW
jgi:hypothetical protein